MNRLLLIILICAASFFTRGISPFAFTQGHLLFAVVATFAFSALIVRRRRIHTQPFLLLLLFFLSLFHLLIQKFAINIPINILVEAGRYSLPLLVSAIFLFFTTISKEKASILRWFIFLNTGLFLIDMLMRLASATSLTSRYSIKHGGFLFVDSNFTGILVVAVYFLLDKSSLYFRNGTFIFFKGILIIILASTGSLSAVVMFSVVWLLHNLSILRKYLFVIVFSQIYLAFLVFNFITDFISDGSFLTKVQIIKSSVISLREAELLSLFLGQGFGLFVEITQQRFPSHNLFGLFVEGGIFFALIQIFTIVVLRPACAVGASLVVGLLFIGLFSLYPLAYLTPFWCVLVLLNSISAPTHSRFFLRPQHKGINVE